MINNKKRPCYKCEKRHTNCHSHCEDYFGLRAEFDEAAERRAARRFADAVTIDLVLACKARAGRRKK